MNFICGKKKENNYTQLPTIDYIDILYKMQIQMIRNVRQYFRVRYDCTVLENIKN